MSFLIDVQAKTFTDIYDKIRALGYKSAINCSNQAERAVDLYLNSLGDVMEKNAYWNHPSDNYTTPATFHNSDMSSIDPRIYNDNQFKNHNVGVVSRCSVADKPLIVTEWNAAVPAEFKSDAIFQMAAYGAFQGWDGFCVFNYTFSGDSGSFFSINGYTDFFTFCIEPAVYGQFGQAAMIFRQGIVSEAENSVELVLTKEDILAQNSHFYKAPQYIPFVSKFSYRFINEKYDSSADMVIPSGNTASGDYTKAKHLLMLTENIYSDAYNKIEGRDEWYEKHTQRGSVDFTVGSLTFSLGESAAVAQNYDVKSGMFYSGRTDLDEVFTSVMHKFGLLDKDKGYLSDKVVSDTGELTYIYNSNFVLNTERAAVFAGKTVTGIKGNEFGECRLVTGNDKAAVSVISTDGLKSIKSSSKLNIYALGRSTNTGLVWGEKSYNTSRLEDLGTGPILVEDIRGVLTIPSDAHTCTVYGLDSIGGRVSTVESKPVDGGFEITLGGFVNYEVVLE